jgi:hypothetical protein
MPVGEISYIWTQHFLKDHLCGCGQPFHACEFWNAVMVDAFGGMDHVDAQYISALQHSVQAQRHFPLMAFPRLRSADFQRRLREYTDILGSLYRSIQNVSHCNEIVDSSKSPNYALAVAEMDSAKLKMIHLVRDSRACAYARQAKRRRIDNDGNVTPIPGDNCLKTALNWNSAEAAMALVANRVAMYTTVRYEDLATNPQGVLAAVANTLGVANPAFPFISDHTVNLEPDHVLWGNPSRMSHGSIAIRPDTEWQERMASLGKLEVTVTTLPWLLKYRYLINGSESPALSRVS